MWQCRRDSPENLGRRPHILDLVSFQVRPAPESDSRSEDPGSPAASSVTLSLTNFRDNSGDTQLRSRLLLFVMRKGSLSPPRPL